MKPNATEPPATAIHTPANWRDPLDWRTVFLRLGPVEVDIGCGKGAFLLWAARARPQANFLGVDRLLGRLRKVDGKVRRAGVTNVRLVRIEAGYLVERLVGPGSVAAYHIYFPDPWPKRRHHRRRLFTAEFVEAVWVSLQRGGEVNVATDHAEYFAWIGERLRASGRFEEAAPWPLPAEAATEFERTFTAAGQPIYRSRYVRKG